MPSKEKTQFKSYEEFFVYYMKEHQHPGCRALHYLGTVLGTTLVLMSIFTGNYWFILAAILSGYGCAWIGHFGIEKNIPATFGYPGWSFISDYRMCYLFLTGKIDRYIDQPA